MITAVALSPSLDVTYVVDELDGIQRPIEVHRMAGGKALNAARAAAALGADVAVLTVLGGGTGAMVAEQASSAGIHLVALEGQEVTRTCVSMFARGDGSLTEIYEHPTPVSPDCFEDLLARVPGLLGPRPGWCLVSGGTPDALGERALARIVRTAQDAGARVAVDSHGSALREALASTSPELVKVNRAEAAEVLGVAPGTDLAVLVQDLRALTGGITVVTDGTAGATATDGTVTLRAVLPEPVGTFPVGSGDSFLGGLLVALDRGDPLVDAMRLAMACATANALVPGTARFDVATVQELVPLVRVSEPARAVRHSR